MRTLACLCGLTVLSCAPTPDPPPNDGFDRAAMLGDFVDLVATPALGAFVTASTATESAIGTWGSGGDEADAEEAFKTAWTAWQRIEVMQVGPLGRQGVVEGGGARHDEIYSWPDVVSPCLVDQQLVSGAYERASFFDESGVNVYGLDALEYLLFHPAGNACPSGSPINAEGTWDALVADGYDAARAAYALRITERIKSEATALRDELAAYRDELVGAGASGSPYASAQAAIDDLYAALFYLELKTKDRKLGVPLGLHISCTTDTCPTQVESRWAGISMQHVATNFDQALVVFRGAEGTGFDDMLRNAGAGDLATRFEGELVAARDAAANFTGDIAAAVESDPAAVRAVYDVVKTATDTLKADLVTVLSLRIPAEGATDND